MILSIRLWFKVEYCFTIMACALASIYLSDGQGFSSLLLFAFFLYIRPLLCNENYLYYILN